LAPSEAAERHQPHACPRSNLNLGVIDQLPQDAVQHLLLDRLPLPIIGGCLDWLPQAVNLRHTSLVIAKDASVVSANNNPDRTQFLKLKLEIYLGVQELSET